MTKLERFQKSYDVSLMEASIENLSKYIDIPSSDSGDLKGVTLFFLHNSSETNTNQY